ncbi:OLC1v1017899C1 [Oldenlandia corymbosa var. corymbosa]|uniref:OLC1v1017899C1 n=1 Tax=Oldenlandia corymbosa var. corymbosa TaxID=529605 RepID=A0AAV1EAS4_OLDCO|nr:OLC1v1017899C1 [Oldenlandia corymbosa var. corymbosa]
MAEARGRDLPEYVQPRELVDYDRPPAATAQTCPWLLISHGKEYQKHTFFSVTENKRYTREIPCLRNKTLLGQSYGWMICGDNENCNLFNPVSTEDIQLPPLQADKITNILLSKAPHHPDCLVFIVARSGPNPYHLAFCKIGDEKFVEESNLGHSALVDIFAFKGKVYGLMVDCTLVAFDVIGSTLRTTPLVKDDLPFQISNPLPPENIMSHNVFIDLNNDEEVWRVYKIYSPCFFDEVTHFRIFRLNLNDMICEELESIGERVIFLSPYHGKVYSKPGPGLRINSIYYVEPDDNRLYVHNLENRSRLLKLPCPNIRKDASMSWVFS